MEVKKWGSIFLQRPFIYLSHTPNFLPSLSGAISVAIGSPHQLLSPVRTKTHLHWELNVFPLAGFCLRFHSFVLLSCPTRPSLPRPHGFISVSRPPHLAAAATVWTPRLDLSHTLQNATFITKSPPQSLSVKDFLTRANLRTSSAGGGVIFSHFAQQAYVVHLFTLHFLLCAWFICCSCWTSCGECDVRFNEIGRLQIWRNRIYGSRMRRFNTRWACVQTHFHANTCEYWADFHRGTTAALKQIFQKCSAGMRAVRNVLRGAKGAAVA